jgi:hypothetical protein
VKEKKRLRSDGMREKKRLRSKYNTKVKGVGIQTAEEGD